jgi:hypothetical protein
MLEVVNDTRGTHYTVESLAEVCGVDLATASLYDGATMAGHLGRLA